MFGTTIRQIVVFAAVLTVILAGATGSAAADPTLKKPGDAAPDVTKPAPGTFGVNQTHFSDVGTAVSTIAQTFGVNQTHL